MESWVLRTRRLDHGPRFYRLLVLAKRGVEIQLLMGTFETGDRLAGHSDVQYLLRSFVLHLRVRQPCKIFQLPLIAISRSLTENLDNIKRGMNIAFLCIAIALIPLFIFWMNRQEKLGKPALIPNRLWRNVAFTSISLTVLLSWAVLQSMELFFSLLSVSLGASS